MSERSRLLAVDLAAASVNWALTPEAEAALQALSPVTVKPLRRTSTQNVSWPSSGARPRGDHGVP